MLCTSQTLLVARVPQNQLLRVYNISILPLVLAVVTHVCCRMDTLGLYRSCEEHGDWLGLTVCVLSLPCEFCWKTKNVSKRQVSHIELAHLPAPETSAYSL